MHVDTETGEVTITLPMADTPEGPIAEDTDAAGRLLSYVQRLEKLDTEASELSKLRKDLVAELKSAGFDGSTVLAIVKRRRRKRDEVEKADRLLAHYSTAIDAPTAFVGA